MKINRIFTFAVLTYAIGFLIPCIFNIGFENQQHDNTNQFFEQIKQMSNDDFFIKILKTNLLVIAINILGSMSFGLFTFLNTFYNGFILGFVLKNTIMTNSIAFVFKGLAPHSIEILGIILSCYIGYTLTPSFYNYCFTKNQTFKSPVKSLVTLSTVCVSIIFIAALLEAYVTIR